MLVRRDGVRIFRARIEGPQQLAAVDVEAANDAGRLAVGVVVGHGAGDDDHFIGDHRRRSRLVVARRRIRHVALQVQLAVVGEVRARFAGVGVQREQAAVVDRQNDAARAHRRCGIAGGARGCSGFVVRHAAAGDVLEGRVVLQLRIKFPLFFTGGGIQREQLLVRRTHVKGIADLDRRDFVGDLTRIVGGLQIAGLETPNLLQLANVFVVDLAQRRVTGAFLGAAIGRPVGAVGVFRLHLRGVESAVDLLRIVEYGIGQRDDGDCQRRAQRTVGELAVGDQLTVDKRQHQPQAEEEGDVQARRQRPEVRADFPQGPNSGAQQEYRVQQQRGGAAAEQQPGGRQQHQPGDDVIQRTAQLGQPNAAAEQIKPAQRGK